ncbi:uncharacterized protein EV420DRAFT_1674299 [Desarmillaria tabescens]|uniref:Crossover junction endonuclease MUS81 n=1 Tax=Armillaria tabescens TaxID=1929756 RepID=A0AA39N6W4_ARMTA|nr:uncharacterized protein EV420DRAFT_1674299 [Desarmillaria tabescens]KAK0459485.1 hypothetical protein EV420DRAFT_1674299 [Desarmillaria tabescens]
MPPRKQCANPLFEGWLKEKLMQLKEKTPDSNFCFTYEKALRGIREYPEPVDIHSVTRVKYIGPKIASFLKKKMEQNGVDVGGTEFPSLPLTPKKRGRQPSKKAAQRRDDDSPIAGPSTGKRSVSSRDASGSRPVKRPAYSDGDYSDAVPHNIFQFCYLVSNINEAHIQGYSGENSHRLGYKVRYLVGREYAMQERLYGSKPSGDGISATAFMDIDDTDYFPISTLSPEEFARPSLSDLLSAETAGQRRTVYSLDPSRQASTSYSKASTSTVSSIEERLKAIEERLGNAPHQATTSRSSLQRIGTYSLPSTPQISPSRAKAALIADEPPAMASNVTLSNLNFGRVASMSRSPIRPPPPRSAAPSAFGASRSQSDAARTYEIVLIMDNREIKDQRNRDYFKVQLEARGIKVEVRALVLADACWIARKINRFGDEMDEVVLDAIVERKTLKDLHYSIVKDKRFHEQKFRLHQSGITHVYYLVENYKVDHALKEYELQINTALSSTQVVDGFMVKETRDIKDTITWYVGVHKGLMDAYKEKDLYIIPSTAIRRHSYLDTQKMLRDRHPDRVYLTTFTQFQSLNSKNRFTTVSTVWAKMLLSVHGLSAEKVGAILNKYPTPTSLYVAFREAEDLQRVMQEFEDSNGGPQVPKGKRKARSDVPKAELLLTDINRESGRPIGDALSKKIYTLLMSDDYISDE